jgi:hypothetical protein
MQQPPSAITQDAPVSIPSARINDDEGVSTERPCIVLSGDEARALGEAYALLGRIAERAGLNTPSASEAA